MYIFFYGDEFSANVCFGFTVSSDTCSAAADEAYGVATEAQKGQFRPKYNLHVETVSWK